MKSRTDALARLKTLDWRMEAAPFNAVWQPTPDGKASKGKMIAGKDNQELLFSLLVVHLAPEIKTQITRALSNYRGLKGMKYPQPPRVCKTNLVAAPTEPATEPTSWARTGDETTVLT